LSGGASTSAVADGVTDALADAEATGASLAEAAGADAVVLGVGDCGAVPLPHAMTRPNKTTHTRMSTPSPATRGNLTRH
jgi:hypothetical protein